MLSGLVGHRMQGYMGGLSGRGSVPFGPAYLTAEAVRRPVAPRRRR